MTTRRIARGSLCLGLAFGLLLAAPAPASDTSRHLNRIYRGNDGSALYTRQVGTFLYAFGEHPGTKLAFVLRGTVEGSAVKDVRWWDVPKGKKRRVSSGTMELRWSQNGGRLARISGADPGPDVWQAVSAGGIQWPNKLTAGFQSTSDLTGTFTGDDRARYYVRETGDAVVWVAEKESQPGERPDWVSVFVGKRAGSGLSGTFAHVEKGAEATRTEGVAVLVKADRSMQIHDPDLRDKPDLTPDYALDFGRFGKEIEEAFSGKVVGYGYAIAWNGIVVKRGSGGSRTLAGDGGRKPFTTDTQNSADSSSKTVTAAAVLKVLSEKGVSVDAKFAPYLPSCWKRGRAVSGMTFRDLLAHSSLLYKPSSPDCDKDPLGCLQRSMEIGRRAEQDGTKDGYDYENINYGFFRVLLPMLVAPDKVQAEFAKAGCKTADGKVNAIVSNRFAAYILPLLESLGVKAGFGPTSGNRAYRYNFSRQRLPGIKTFATYLEAGSGGIWVSAPEFVQFLSALERGSIVKKDVLAVMKAGDLGFESKVKLRDALGNCYPKNGGAKDTSGRGSESQLILFPGDVQAFVTVNSRNNTYQGNRRDVLIKAYYAALR